MFNKNKCKKYWGIIIIFIIIILVTFFFLAKYLLTKYAEQVQGFIKDSVSAKVEARIEELDEVIAEVNTQNFSETVIRWNKGEAAIFYKELQNDKITKIFNDFSLVSIEDRMDNSEGGYVSFCILSYAAKLAWGDYDFGFYYSEEDEPIIIMSGIKIAERTKVSEESDPFVRYWYRTEKITDNWWYFEIQWSYVDIPSR